VLTPWGRVDFAGLLAAHGLDGLPEREFPTDGWSGARFSMIEQGRERYVIKRTSPSMDWIAAATDDHGIREAWVAASWPLHQTQGVWPYLGAGADGDEAAILMPDLSTELIAWDRPAQEPPLRNDDLDRVLRVLANLHLVPWPAFLEGIEPFPWTPLPERLLLTSRPMCARHVASGIPAGIQSAQRLLAGWDAFDQYAPAPARRLAADLASDVTPLIRALARLPSVGLHGDLKLANVAIGPGEQVRFIDWSMTIRAPIAVELGWFLVSNSGSLSEPPDQVLERYRNALQTASRTLPDLQDALPDAAGPDIVGDWQAQIDLAMIVGLLLRGFRKGLDTQAGVTLPSGVAAADDLAWWCERAVAASARLG
jgi:aminoglycoside phosphotransferase (APT) family kinase protein